MTHLNLLLLDHTYDHVLLGGASCFGQVLESLLAPVALLRDIYPPPKRLTLCALAVRTLIHPIKLILIDNLDLDGFIHLDFKESEAVLISKLLFAFNALIDDALGGSDFELESFKGYD